jgi:hypothetical protein
MKVTAMMTPGTGGSVLSAQAEAPEPPSKR